MMKPPRPLLNGCSGPRFSLAPHAPTCCGDARRSAHPRPLRSAPVNHYEVLGIPSSATAEEIKARYRELAKATHPDVNGAADAVERFVSLRRAYDALLADMLRAEHDQQLGEGAGGGAEKN